MGRFLVLLVQTIAEELADALERRRERKAAEKARSEREAEVRAELDRIQAEKIAKWKRELEHARSVHPVDPNPYE